VLPDFRVRQRDYLLEIARAITEQLELSTVLKRILQAAVELTAGQAGLIALREGGRWRLRAYVGIPEQFISAFDPLLADIPDQGDPERFELPEVSRRLRRIGETASLGLLTGVGLPMVARKEVVGLIFILRGYGSQFSANDRALLSSFAVQAAIAVHNAILYQQVSVEKRRLDAVLDSYADGILIIDPAGKITRFNRALSTITTLSATEALGMHHDDVIRWANRERGPDLNAAMADGWPLPGTTTPIYVEGDLLRHNGGIVPVGVSYAAVFDREGRLLNIIADVHDMTRIREAEELKSTFISVVSHELKTPVALIKGYAETLSREDAKWDRETVRDSLAVIVDEADRLTELIESLLDASRLQSGDLKLNIGEVAVDALAQQLIEKFKTQTSKHTLVADFPADFPEVRGDEERLRQVLANLLSNAIKYAPNGGEIRVTGSAMPEWVEVRVSDQGAGIAAHDLPHIFDRFYRAEGDLTKRVKGTGLGLFLARAIVVAHGGDIKVDSEPGKGSTFTVTLPRYNGDLAS
jgi:PAS domain S-box-containing protein